MDTKICTICGIEFYATNEYFYSSKGTLDCACKFCRKASAKEYAIKNPYKVKGYKEKYRLNNSELIKELKKKYSLENPEKIKKESGELYRLNNSEKIKIQHAKYRKENQDKIQESGKNYRNINSDKEKVRHKNYGTENREKINARKKNRRNSDLNYKILCNMRTRMNKALRGLNKSARTMELVGCSIEFLKAHLESQFEPWMTWKNYGKGGWEVDHIRPCASFSDLSDPEQQRECFNWKNLQPMKAEENASKGSMYEGIRVRI